MPTAPVNGQFGPNTFEVLSLKGVPVAAKYLTDAAGANYILNPITQAPYVVPLNYDPAVIASQFTTLLNNALANSGAVSAMKNVMYPALKEAFVRGGSGDLQRPLRDKPNVVLAFIPAASYNLGVAAAAGGISAAEAIVAGGIYNVQINGIGKFWNNPLAFGNNPGNATHIIEGSSTYLDGKVGTPGASISKTTSGAVTTTQIDVNADGRPDVVSKTTTQPDNTTTTDSKYLSQTGTVLEQSSTTVSPNATIGVSKIDNNGDGVWDSQGAVSADGSASVQYINLMYYGQNWGAQTVFINADGVATFKAHNGFIEH